MMLLSKMLRQIGRASKSTPLAWRRSCGRAPSLLLLCLLLALPGRLFAEDPYLRPGRLDGVALLPPPPAAGSAEETADLASTRAVFAQRTPAEEARAKKDSSLGFSIFAPAIGPCFELDKLPRTAALLEKVKKEIGEAIDIPKDHWKRLRPYQLDHHLNSGKPEPSFSYPSGHSTRGTVYALVLAEICPERNDAIAEVGREIGWDRIILGKHYPTDVYAGRTLGQAIFRELEATPAFQRDLALAKAELQAACAHTSGKPTRN